MSAYLKHIDWGYPGAMSRAHEGRFMIKSEIAGPLTPMIFGKPVLFSNVDGTVNLYDHTKAATDTFMGFLVRPYPKQGVATLLGDADPSYEGEVVSVMQSGYMTVKLSGGSTPVKRGDPVGVAVASSGTGSTAIEAGDVVADVTEPLTGAFFNADAKPGDIVEIYFNI